MPGAAVRTTRVTATGGSGAIPDTPPSAAPAAPEVGHAIGSAAAGKVSGVDSSGVGSSWGANTQRCPDLTRPAGQPGQDSAKKCAAARALRRSARSQKGRPIAERELLRNYER